MKKNIFFLILICVLCFVSSIDAQNNNSDKSNVEMLRNFYTEYNAVWSVKPPLASQIFDRKLDSLMIKYCTLKLRNRAKKNLKDGIDILTNDQASVYLNEKLEVEKDSAIENGYIVRFVASNINASRKLIKQNVVLHISVVKGKDDYRISEVK